MNIISKERISTLRFFKLMIRLDPDALKLNIRKSSIKTTLRMHRCKYRLIISIFEYSNMLGSSENFGARLVRQYRTTTLTLVILIIPVRFLKIKFEWFKNNSDNSDDNKQNHQAIDSNILKTTECDAWSFEMKTPRTASCSLRNWLER